MATAERISDASKVLFTYNLGKVRNYLVHAVAYLVEAPCYKPKGRGFDSR
jgi:hypothetical protein